MKESLKVQEAHKKLQTILKLAEVRGIRESDICEKAEVFGLISPWPHRRFYKTMVMFCLCFSVLAITYNLNLHQNALNIYWEWKHGVKSHEQCAVPVPDTLNRIFRPPMDCSVCAQVTEVEKVENLPPELFEESYAYSGKPVIITDGTKNWTASKVFSFEFFQNLYEENLGDWNTQCQFFPYKTNFRHLGEFLTLTPEGLNKSSPWYVGWIWPKWPYFQHKIRHLGEHVTMTPDYLNAWYFGWSNCDVKVTDVLRRHYSRPYFLPGNSEGKRLDWIFMGSSGYGAPMHVDNVEYPSWQAQLRGRKKWTLQPAPECIFQCAVVEVVVEPGEIIVLDTNQWYHETMIVSDEISITIGAEYD